MMTESPDLERPQFEILFGMGVDVDGLVASALLHPGDIKREKKGESILSVSKRRELANASTRQTHTARMCVAVGSTKKCSKESLGALFGSSGSGCKECVKNGGKERLSKGNGGDSTQVADL